MGIDRFFPKASMKVSRTMTMPRTNSIAGRGTINSGMAEETKEVPYISFSAVVGRNSRFHDLTEEQMDELGGVEYRGLRVLLYIVSGVCHFSHLKNLMLTCSTLSFSNLPLSSLSPPTSMLGNDTRMSLIVSLNTYRRLGSRFSMPFRHSRTREPVSPMLVSFHFRLHT